MLRLTGKFLAELGVLRSNAHRAGVEVTLAHHDAAQGNQRQGGETELLRAEQGCNRHVTPRRQFAVHLEAHAAAEVVHHQHLLGFRKTQLPRGAGVPDGGDGRRAGAAIVAADEDHVGVRLGHARRYRAHARLGHEFDGDARLRVSVLQIVDQLRQVFDGVDVVVRRGRNKLHTRDGVADSRHNFIHLMAR